MPDFTLTQMTDIIASVQGFSFSESRVLHRQLKGLAQHGLIRPIGASGTAERSADLYDLHAVCMARVFAALTAANWEVRAFRLFVAPSDSFEGAGHRYASGLENAVAAAIDGNAATARFEILDGKKGVRAYFDHTAADAETNAEIDAILADADARNGGSVATVTLHTNALVQPILDHIGAN